MKKAAFLALFLAGLVCLPSVCSAESSAVGEDIQLTSPTERLVASGDTLWKISKEIYHSGKYWQKIFYANKLEKNSSGAPIIVKGQKLIIPPLTGDEALSASYVWTSEKAAKNAAFLEAGGKTKMSTANSDGVRWLYRVVKDCATGQPIGENYEKRTEFKPNMYITGHLQMINLDKTGYINYTCANRYREQCILDGSFDSYYEEWCTGNPNKDLSEDIIPNEYKKSEPPKLSAEKSIEGMIKSLLPDGDGYLKNKIDKPNYGDQGIDNSGMVLFRVVRNCATGQPIGESYEQMTEFKHDQFVIGYLQMINLEKSEDGYYSNYSCQNRYQEHCLGDGSFDSYYEEFCSKK